MPKRKHSRTEIESKLAQANDLASQGKLQSDIARTLGISVMTLHRWRKTATPMAPGVTNQTTQFEHELGQGSRTEEIRLENSRLRRLVTDLLLEKIKLEEAASANRSTTRRASV
jgi:putative transposase